MLISSRFPRSRRERDIFPDIFGQEIFGEIPPNLKFENLEQVNKIQKIPDGHYLFSKESTRSQLVYGVS